MAYYELCDLNLHVHCFQIQLLYCTVGAYLLLARTRASDKRGYSGIFKDNFSLFLTKTYVVTLILMMGHKIFSNGEIWPIIPVTPSYLELCRTV